jgi:dihydroorotase-like cyclic amidohydrolase
VVLINLDKEVEVDDSFFQSKSRNSPLIGQALQGSIETTIVGGKVVYRDRAFTA